MIRAMIVLTLLFMLSVPSLMAEGDTPQGPRIKFHETKYDFGELYQYQETSHVFTFENIGDQPLEITDIVRTCGCTAVTSGDDVIAPGGTGTVKVVFNAENFAGPVDKVIKVLSNDPENGEVRLYISGKILVAVEISPDMIYVRDALIGDMVKRDFTIAAAENKPLQILSVKTSNENLSVTYESVAGREGSYQFHLTYPAKPPVGVFQESIEIQTDNPVQPRIVVPVSGRIIGQLSISPRALLFRILDPAGQSKKRLTINKRGDATLEVTSVTCDLPNIKVKTSPVEKGKLYEVDLEVSPPVDENRIEGTLLIETNIPGEESIQVPVRILVSPNVLPAANP